MINSKSSNFCKKDTIYVVDNCWPIVYKKPYVSHILDHLSNFHTKYLLTAKPQLLYPKKGKNVFVHIRRGDSTLR